MNNRLIVSIVSTAVVLATAAAPALADAKAQARRMRHFDYLHARGVFESKSLVAGAPTLVLGSGKSQVEPESLKVFCRIVFEYFVESDARHGSMRVVDGTTGRQIAVVDRTGYRDVP
jgi:hypothetical protein